MSNVNVLERISAPTDTPTSTPRKSLGRRVGLTGIAVALGLVVLGTLMKTNADFAETYVAEQLGEKRITFKSADALTPEEREQPCLVAYAGTRLTTGAHAECYAMSFIGQHLPKIANGKTFSELREVQTSLRAELARAQAASDPSAGDLQRQLNEVTAKRQSLFEGETMKGLLLTAYGFSTLGTKAGQAATASYAGAGAILLLSVVVLARSRVRASGR
jgi:hypothetical protein